MLSEHIHLFDYVPQAAVLEHADWCITQDGFNTIHGCLNFEVPMLLYSTAFADKHVTTARLVYHGLCHQGDIEIDGPDDISRRVSEIFADKDLVARLGQWRSVPDHYRYDCVLENCVEKFLTD